MMNEPEWVFPFEWMEVGNSFFIPTLHFAKLMFAIEEGAKRAGIRVKCYVSSKDNHLGVRAWRVR
jgi:hypothetical protein